MHNPIRVQKVGWKHIHSSFAEFYIRKKSQHTLSDQEMICKYNRNDPVMEIRTIMFFDEDYKDRKQSQVSTAINSIFVC